jgi:hypothetical protein
MRKLAMMIVPMAILIAFGTAALADQASTELNSELSGDLAGKVAAEVRSDQVRTDLDDTLQDDSELAGAAASDSSSRGERALTDRRGRQARRGQTALAVVGDQWGGGGGGGGNSNDEDSDDNGGGKGKGNDEGGDDEGDDDDEDGETPTGN